MLVCFNGSQHKAAELPLIISMLEIREIGMMGFKTK